MSHAMAVILRCHFASLVWPTILIWGFALSQQTASAPFQNFFVQPAPTTGVAATDNDFALNPVYEWGSNMALSWHTNWTLYNIKLYQFNNDAFWIFTPNDYSALGAQDLPYNCTFPLVFLDESQPLVFYFRTNNVIAGWQTYNSQWFNLTAPPMSTTSSAPPPVTSFASTSTSLPATSSTSTSSPDFQTPSSTPSTSTTALETKHTSTSTSSSSQSSTTSTTSVTTSTSITPSPEAIATQSTVMPTGELAGIIIGSIAIILLMVSLLCVMLYLRRRRAKRIAPTPSFRGDSVAWSRRTTGMNGLHELTIDRKVLQRSPAELWSQRASRPLCEKGPDSVAGDAHTVYEM